VRTLAAAASIVWALLFASTIWWVGTEGLMTIGNSQCVRTTSMSSSQIVGPSTWGWIPPGKVCHYEDGVTTRPSAGRVVFIAALLGATPLALRVARRRRDSRDRVERL
jgi:hypothetical protein